MRNAARTDHELSRRVHGRTTGNHTRTHSTTSTTSTGSCRSSSQTSTVKHNWRDQPQHHQPIAKDRVLSRIREKNHRPALTPKNGSSLAFPTTRRSRTSQRHFRHSGVKFQTNNQVRFVYSQGSDPQFLMGYVNRRAYSRQTVMVFIFHMEPFIDQEGLTEEYETKDHVPVTQKGGEYRRSKRGFTGKREYYGLFRRRICCYIKLHTRPQSHKW